MSEPRKSEIAIIYVNYSRKKMFVYLILFNNNKFGVAVIQKIRSQNRALEIFTKFCLRVASKYPNKCIDRCFFKNLCF